MSQLPLDRGRQAAMSAPSSIDQVDHKDVPFDGHQVLQKYIDGIAFHPIKNADHAALYTHSTLVNKLILDFIK